MFVAADLRDADAQRVVRAIAPLRARHPQARWTRPEQLHLTMAFLGATDPAVAPHLERAIAEVAARWSPFAVTTGAGGGYVDERRGGVAWLRVGEGYDRVAKLSRELDAAMGTNVFAKIGPRPHLTLARGMSEELLADLREFAPGLALGWTVDNVALFRSHTDRTGSRYEELARHRLAAAKP